MIAAGLRCSPHKVFYTIIELKEDDSFSLVNQELIASSNVEFYFTGVKGSIASKLGIGNDGAISLFIDGSQDFNNITDWKSFSMEHRESILVGFASLTL